MNMFTRSSSLMTLLFCIYIFKSFTCIEIVQLSVPRFVKERGTARLRCVYRFTPGDKSVYSLKWLLGKQEFYRETSNSKNSKQMFKIKNIFQVDLENSGNGTVTLTNMTREASGNYVCEVTTYPNMETEYQSKELVMQAVSNQCAKDGFQWTFLLSNLILAILIAKNISC